MLTEERWNAIIERVDREKAITVPELEKALGVSAATIRRDLTQLNKMGRIVKVHGGATSVQTHFISRDLSIEEKHSLNSEEKLLIAEYAARLIEPNDFIFIDAGTTTELLIDCITEINAGFVTNSLMHAERLTLKGCRVYLTGGELKAMTDALVGPITVDALQKMHFTKGFWGTNGVTSESGFTTPEPNEAMIKKVSMQQTSDRYVLCDASKFSAISAMKFADFSSATIITDRLTDKRYSKYSNIVEVAK